MTSNPRFWQIGGVVAVFLTAYLAWMLLLNPVFEEAARTREETVSTEGQIDRARAQTSKLVEQQADLQDQVQALEALRDKIPKDVDVPKLMRTIQAEARMEGVQLDSLQPGQITLFEVTEPTPSPSASANGEPAPAQDAPAPKPTPSNLGQGLAPRDVGLAYVPLSLAGQGDYRSIRQLTARLEQQQRAFLVTMLDIQRQTDSEAKNPLTFTMQAEVFVLNGGTVQLPDGMQDG